MKVCVYSVFDSATASFDLPFTALRDEAAQRAFADAVNGGAGPNPQWNRHPEDFSLFSIGEFDDQTGVLKPHAPVKIVTASALYRAPDVPKTVSELKELLPS